MQHLDFGGKTVLVRVDFNVPVDSNGRITDDTRIRKALPTLQAIIDEGGRVVLMSHLGRPQKKRLEDGSIDVARFSLVSIAEHLSKLMHRQVVFANDCAGPQSRAALQMLDAGGVLLMENTRFNPGEEKGDESFASRLSEMGDIYINDAFGTAHRAHASTTIVAGHFEPVSKGFGLLMQAENR